MGSGNWIVDNLNSALEMWNGRLAEIWQLISTSPESFKGGGVWNAIVNINDGLKAVGYALLVLFFVMGVVKTCGSFTEMKKPEVAFKCFIRFVLAQAAVSWGMELMTGAFRVAQGMVTTIMDSSGLTAMSATTLPDELVSVIEDVGFIDSIPLWAVTLLGSLFIWVLSLVMILTVYSRFFKLYIATAIAPIPLASFAGQPSSSIGVAFLKSYAAICLEGCVIVLACVIFSAFASSPPAIADDTLAAATIVWNYVGELIFNMLVLLTIFYFIDKRAYRQDIASGLKPDISKPGTEVKLRGAHNLIFLVMIVAAVILSGTLPSMPQFQDAAGKVLGIHLFGEVELSYPAIIEIVIILVAAFLSFKTTKVEIRRENHFTWGAIQEVAVLFIGIFITMQPALMILKANGANLGISEPFEMFWATGLLSSFLDNTPTYLVFLTTAGALGFTEGMVTTLGTVPIKMLMAISCGAVFMGANTYIGNAPNFMVKSIADENGVRMPSFFGYLLWSFGILVPVFALDMLLFFL